MKHLLLLPLLLFPLSAASQTVVFWNVENMFVPWGDNTGADADFRSGGKRGWNYERYIRKCNAIAKSLICFGDALGGEIDFIAFAEIENASVLKDLIRRTPLHRYPYRYIHFDSPDRRGIDVALLYDTIKYRCISAFPKNVVLDSVELRTRSILFASFERRADGERINVSVNHHPSKYSGAEATARAREAAIGTLAAAADSMYCRDSCLTVLVGDFNEVPLSDTLSGSDNFINLAYRLHMDGKGTIKFSGKWELIDHFYIPKRYFSSYEMEILSPYFLLEKDRKFIGYKPRRTYIGPRYNGGISDHLPIVLHKS